MSKARECGEKRAFATSKDAMNAAHRKVKQLGLTYADTWVYKCKWCKQWHHGHRPGRSGRFRG